MAHPLMWHALEWTGICAVWTTFAWQVSSIVHRHRRDKAGQALMIAEIAREEEVTPLQIQAAMDAAGAVFVQRIEEMRRANRANS